MNLGLFDLQESTIAIKRTVLQSDVEHQYKKPGKADLPKDGLVFPKKRFHVIFSSGLCIARSIR